jgi:rRNA-processing protein FCF1
MKKVILDTSFIISCIKNKIDFLEEIKYLGLKPILLKKIINELENKNSIVGLNLLKRIKPLNLGNSHADKQIISLAKKNPEIIVATLDKKIIKSLTNKKLIIRGKKKLEIIS